MMCARIPLKKGKESSRHIQEKNVTGVVCLRPRSNINIYVYNLTEPRREYDDKKIVYFLTFYCNDARHQKQNKQKVFAAALAHLRKLF